MQLPIYDDPVLLDSAWHGHAHSATRTVRVGCPEPLSLVPRTVDGLLVASGGCRSASFVIGEEPTMPAALRDPWQKRKLRVGAGRSGASGAHQPVLFDSTSRLHSVLGGLSRTVKTMTTPSAAPTRTMQKACANAAAHSAQ